MKQFTVKKGFNRDTFQPELEISFSTVYNLEKLQDVGAVKGRDAAIEEIAEDLKQEFIEKLKTL